MSLWKIILVGMVFFAVSQTVSFLFTLGIIALAAWAF